MLAKVNEVPNFLRNLTPNVWGHFSSSARKKGESIPQKYVCVCEKRRVRIRSQLWLFIYFSWGFVPLNVGAQDLMSLRIKDE